MTLPTLSKEENECLNDFLKHVPISNFFSVYEVTEKYINKRCQEINQEIVSELQKPFVDLSPENFHLVREKKVNALRVLANDESNKKNRLNTFIFHFLVDNFFVDYPIINLMTMPNNPVTHNLQLSKEGVMLKKCGSIKKYIKVKEEERNADDQIIFDNRLMLKFTRIAAWGAVIGVIIGLIALGLTIYFTVYYKKSP